MRQLTVDYLDSPGPFIESRSEKTLNLTIEGYCLKVTWLLRKESKLSVRSEVKHNADSDETSFRCDTHALHSFKWPVQESVF